MTSAYLGQRLSFDGALCTVRYIGAVKGTKGEWLGVEWDDSSRGKHSGEHGGTGYFRCKTENAGSFIRPNRPSDPPRTFLEGLKRKYVTNIENSGIAKPVEFGTKLVEEVGFEKVSKKFSEIQSLQRVLLDYMCIRSCDQDATEISSTCPNISHLDLTCNLIEDFEEIARICASLPELRSILVNGNRFSKVTCGEYAKGFVRITSLRAEDLCMDWADMFILLNYFHGLTELSIAVGSITQLDDSIAPGFSDLPFTGNLTSICLEENAIVSIDAVSALQKLPHLRKIELARNNVESVFEREPKKSICFQSVTYLDVSINKIANWTFLDDLRLAFPNLEALRISRNPVYGSMDDKALSEESYMYTVGRLGRKVNMLNYSMITAGERSDAELFYMSTIVKELSENPPEKEHEILSRHTRWQELQGLHGQQTVSRGQTKIAKDALASKLIEIEILHPSKSLTKKFPRSVKVGKLSGLIGRLIGENPLDIKLILIEDGIAGYQGARETILRKIKARLAHMYAIVRYFRLQDELREIDYYVDGETAKIAVRSR